MNRIVAFLFDLGGVLIIQDTQKAIGEFSSIHNIPEDRIREYFYAYFNASSTDKSITTELFFKENRGGIQTVLSHDQWLALLTAIYSTEVLNRELANWIRTHPRYRYFALTNNTAGIETVLERKFGIAGLFKEVINSAEIGAKKPEAKAFTYALKKMRVEAPQCVFVDDNETNIHAARSLGFQAIRYTSFENFLRDSAVLLKHPDDRIA